jgi:uridine kinase
MKRDDIVAELAGRIARLRLAHPVRIALDGVDASGKTMLADELVQPIRALGRNVIRASIDRFHNRASIRMRRGPDSPEGYFRDSFDHAQLIKVLLEPLGPGGTRRYRRAVFDFRSDSPVTAPVEEAAPDSVLLFDGVFLLRPELRRYWDFSIFVEADFQVTVKRAEERDLELFGSRAAVRRRYAQRYVPGQQLYLSEVQPERWASVIINNNDPGEPRLAHAAQQGAAADEPQRA